MESLSQLLTVSLLVAAAGGALAAALCQRAALRLVSRWRAGRRCRRAARGERDAERLLERQGYRVVERQPSRRWAVVVDGQPTPIDLRADLLVERRGRRYVAEVKTGDRAPSIASPATRRQLLEYRVAYDVVAALLVDAEAGAVHHVSFPRVGSPSRVGTARLALVAGLLGVALGAVVTRWLE